MLLVIATFSRSVLTQRIDLSMVYDVILPLCREHLVSLETSDKMVYL